MNVAEFKMWFRGLAAGVANGGSITGPQFKALIEAVESLKDGATPNVKVARDNPAPAAPYREIGRDHYKIRPLGQPSYPDPFPPPFQQEPQYWLSTEEFVGELEKIFSRPPGEDRH